MPAYAYTSTDGDTIEHFCRMSEVTPTIKVGGKVYRRDYTAEDKGCWMADHDWTGETNGKGRYISQLADRPGDPKAYCRTQREAIDKAKRKGYQVERER